MAHSSRTITVQVSFSTIKDNENFFDCGKTDIVTRTLPYTTATAQVAMEQLFLGPTTQEKTDGLRDFWITEATAQNLKRVFIKNGTAYLDWKDIRQVIPNVSTSCGSASFFGPIEATLKQFPNLLIRDMWEQRWILMAVIFRDLKGTKTLGLKIARA